MDDQQFELTPAELKAIEEHKYFMSLQRGAEISIEEASADFLRHYAADWRRAKLLQDNQAQRQEIEKHRYLRSQAEGRDIGRAAAAQEWCGKYAHIWRAERESLERNGFLRRTLTLRNARCLHMRPSSEVAMLAHRFDCDVYVHKDGMTFHNFLLQGRPYLNVRSLLGLLSLELVLGDTLEFIATGAQAGQALDAIEKLVSESVSLDAPTACSAPAQAQAV